MDRCAEVLNVIARAPAGTGWYGVAIGLGAGNAGQRLTPIFRALVGGGLIRHEECAGYPHGVYLLTQAGWDHLDKLWGAQGHSSRTARRGFVAFPEGVGPNKWKAGQFGPASATPSPAAALRSLCSGALACAPAAPIIPQLRAAVYVRAEIHPLLRQRTTVHNNRCPPPG